MKWITWNVNSLKVRWPQVEALLLAERPDVLCLQEIKMQTPDCPSEAVQALGYIPIWHGQKAYNGVAIFSKVPGHNTVNTLLDHDPQSRLLATTIGDVRVINVYIPNGESISSDKYRYKLEWLEAFHAFLAQTCLAHERVVVVGDFNIAPTDQDVYDPKAWEGHVLCSAPERAQLQRYFDLGLLDALRVLHPTGAYYTWWDYRTRGFARNNGLRIDLILTSQALAAQIQRVEVLTAYRALERPSDHAPVVIECGIG